MTVTNATPQDLPAMIALLKQSLGENLIPKSEGFFVWKHYQNPFGPSKVLLAREGEQVIGLRAFMYWTWVSGREQIRAVRAVDTATDPAHQGKGIFRKLTMQAVDECKQEGVGLVFNSPNPISMQGYLKMGWKQAGKMPICLKPGSIFPRLFKEGAENDLLEPYRVDQAIAPIGHRAFDETKGAPWHTALSKEYLQWRYHDCPVVQYGAVTQPGAYGFVFRLKRINRFYELRICEAWTEKNDPAILKEARRGLSAIIQKIRPLMVSYADSVTFMDGQSRPGRFFGPYPKGPMVTIRPLALENLDHFESFHHWKPSMGTMELF